MLSSVVLRYISLVKKVSPTAPTGSLARAGATWMDEAAAAGPAAPPATAAPIIAHASDIRAAQIERFDLNLSHPWYVCPEPWMKDSIQPGPLLIVGQSDP